MTLPRIDHLVINTRCALDEACQRFDKLGFSLTERGHHSLGSINNLMMFDDDYLELIGVPAAADGSPAVQRAGISDAPVGMNGLVFKTDDVDADYARLCELNMQSDPPKSFSRPVVLADGSTRDASFRTVHANSADLPGRVYFCQHQTPELVWLDGLPAHENGVQSIQGITVVAQDPEEQLMRLSQIAGSPVPAKGTARILKCQGAAIDFLTPQQYQDQYGALASQFNAQPMFGAITLACQSAPQNESIIREASFDTVIQFVGPN